MVRLRSAKIVVNYAAARKEDMRKYASSERSELHVAFKHIAVGKHRIVEHTHPATKFCRLQIHEFAMLKITTIKTFVGQIDVFECDSRGVQSDDFLMLVYIIVNFFLCLFRIRRMFETKILSFGNFAIVVKNGESHFVAAVLLTFVLLEHNLYFKHLNEICQMFTMKICVGNAAKKSICLKAFTGILFARNVARICIAVKDANFILREVILIAAKVSKIWSKKRIARISANILWREKIPSRQTKSIRKKKRTKNGRLVPLLTRFFLERI